MDIYYPRHNGENYSDSFECANYNLKFSKDDLEKFSKSNILTIEEKYFKSTKRKRRN